MYKTWLQVKATPHISIHRRGTQAFVRTGANKAKLEDAVRRFYNTNLFSLPGKALYKDVPTPERAA